MKQLSWLFPFGEKESKKNIWHLYIDGASRNNPGPAGVGIYILKNDCEYERHGFFIGNKTNNQAEYLALVLGLLLIVDHLHPQDQIIITSDSELLVKQIKGMYRVKNTDLFILYSCAMDLLSKFSYTIKHVLREHNKIADQLANKGIDQKIPVPDQLQEKLPK